MRLISVVLLLWLIAGCGQKQITSKEESKAAIAQTEYDFAQMAKEKGIAVAFAFYADTSAVILRNNSHLLQGKDSIRAFYRSREKPGDLLEWAPDFVDVSTSGDLGYTYGRFTFTKVDSLGVKTLSTGYFHTVWKRQADGNWRFVWD